MSRRALYICYLLTQLPICIANQCIPSLTSPNLPYSTTSPINIITSKAIPVNSTTPLTLSNNIFDALFSILTVTNEGNLIQAVPTFDFLNGDYVTGGVLCNKIYKFYKTLVVIDQNIFGRVDETIDGQGGPIEVAIIYYNVEYGSYEKAMRKPGGIVLIATKIAISPFPNLFFGPFQTILKSGALRQPDSSVQILAPLFYSWFATASPTMVYYTYRGSIRDIETGKETAETIIIVPSQRRFLSPNQFAAFKNVLNSKGQPIQTTVLINPQGKRPVYKAFGAAVALRLF